MNIWLYLAIILAVVAVWAIVEVFMERRRPHSRANFIRLRNLEAQEDAHAEQAENERRRIHRRHDDQQFPIGQ